MTVEVREHYIAQLMRNPKDHGLTEAKFVHAPHIITAHSTRLRCQYLCHTKGQSAVCPPSSPTQLDTIKILEEYRFGLMLRREIEAGTEKDPEVWASFQAAMLFAEGESSRRGYSKAFAIGVGNCIYQHLSDDTRPCEYPGKSRPTLEAIGVNLTETLDILGWDAYLVRKPQDPFQMFALLLLE
jgi:predicted metal-binding protein